MTIRDAHDTDVAAITEVQNAFIATEAIEWTDTPHTVAERAAWLAGQRTDGFPVLVATAADDDDAVVGWASLGPFRDSRKWPGYRLTVEHTIHVRQDHWSAGVGRALMLALIDRATAMGLHVMVAAVDGANDASIRFHERLGFREVARMPQVGTKLGRWLDMRIGTSTCSPRSPTSRSRPSEIASRLRPSVSRLTQTMDRRRRHLRRVVTRSARHGPHHPFPRAPRPRLRAMRVFVIWFLVLLPVSVVIGIVASLASHERKRDR